jgi:hypothetical protein
MSVKILCFKSLFFQLSFLKEKGDREIMEIKGIRQTAGRRFAADLQKYFFRKANF